MRREQFVNLCRRRQCSCSRACNCPCSFEYSIASFIWRRNITGYWQSSSSAAAAAAAALSCRRQKCRISRETSSPHIYTKIQQPFAAYRASCRKTPVPWLDAVRGTVVVRKWRILYSLWFGMLRWAGSGAQNPVTVRCGAWPRPRNPRNRAAAASASQTTSYTIFPIFWHWQ